MLKNFSRDQIRSHLNELGIRPGHSLVVHSRLLSFGLLAGGAGDVLDELRMACGDDGTLVFPTYTFDPAAIYNRATSPSTNVGILSEHARGVPGAVRSASPIHNHVGIGPRAGVLHTTPATVSLGPGSDFEALERAGFDLLLLGCGFSQACTFLHHMEAMAEVPYRKWIEVERRVTSPDGSLETVKVRYFARAEDNLHANFDVVIPLLEKAGALRSAPLPLGGSYLVGLTALRQAAEELLRTDSYALVRRVTPKG